MKITKLLMLTLMAGLLGCEPNNPSDNYTAGFSIPADSKAAPLTQAEFNALSPEEQYRVANKLLGTMFRGVSVNDFFDLSQGINNLTPKDPNFLGTIARKLTLTLPTQTEADILNSSSNPPNPPVLSIDEIKSRIGGRGNPNELFTFSPAENSIPDGARSPKELALARSTQLPLSSDSFNHWIAYILTNTILFSPAEEIDSTTIYDAEAVYNRLVDQLDNKNSINEMIVSHENSPENWRRFRSPEDNTREMIEIYLGIFVPEPDGVSQNDVVNASIACKNYYLTSDDSTDRYRRIITENENTTQVKVLDTFVTTCPEFYSLVAGRPEATPRMISTIVETFMLDRKGTDRAAMIQSINDAGPSTFQDIFAAILFSKEYLLYTERTKSYEENFYNIAARLKYALDTANFQDTADCRNNNGCLTDLKAMNWPVMSNKLGRLAGVPVDTLSFAHYHRAFREGMVIERQNYSSGLIYKPDIAEPDIEDINSTIPDSSIISSMTPSDLLDYLFLTMLERKPDADERATFLTSIGISNSISDTELVLDYLSRLPEQYYFNCTKGMTMSGNMFTGDCVQ